MGLSAMPIYPHANTPTPVSSHAPHTELCVGYVLPRALVRKMCLYDCSAGLKLLGAFTDLNEASSLSYANDVIDIYSNSWGPCDEGCVDGPMRLTHLALKTGAERVRRLTLHCG